MKKQSADDSDESSDHAVKKKGKSKWQCVETSGDDTESVEEDVEAVEVMMVTHNSRIPPKTWITINVVKLCKKSLLKRIQHLIYLLWCQIELPLSSI